MRHVHATRSLEADLTPGTESHLPDTSSGADGAVPPRKLAPLLHLAMPMKQLTLTDTGVPAEVTSRRADWPEPRPSCHGCLKAPYDPGSMECGICTIGYASVIWEILLDDPTVREKAEYQGINLVELMAHPLTRIVLEAVKEYRLGGGQF